MSATLKAAAALLLLSLPCLADDRSSDLLPVEFLQCAAQCERNEPGDRGQGCIDVECNPLLSDE